MKGVGEIVTEGELQAIERKIRDRTSGFAVLRGRTQSYDLFMSLPQPNDRPNILNLDLLPRIYLPSVYHSLFQQLLPL